MSVDAAVAAFRSAALERAVRGPDARVAVGPLLRGRLVRTPDAVDLAADMATRSAAHHLLSHGWTPRHIHRFAARRYAPLTVDYLCDALAAAAQWTAHPPWLGDLAPLQAKVWWTVGEPHLRQWRTRHRLPRAEAIAVVIDVLAMLEHLPRTDLPLTYVPETALPRIVRLVTDRDVVRRVDALLAKARAGNYPAEAVASAAKARELVTRYASTRTARRRPA